MLYHGEVRDAPAILQRLPGIDLVLTGHAQRMDSWEENGVCFVGGGLDTELIMVVKATLAKKKWKFSVTSQPMDQTVDEDKQIKTLVEQFNNRRKER